MALPSSDRKDPIMAMREALDADRRKKSLCADLWSMVNFLYDSVNRTAAENVVLKNDLLILKAQNTDLCSSNVHLNKRILDLQDEFRVFKQIITAKLQSINPHQSMDPTINTLSNTANKNVVSFLQKIVKPSSPSSSSPATADFSARPSVSSTSTEVNLTVPSNFDSGQQEDTWATVVLKKRAVRGSQLVNLNGLSGPGETLLTLSTIKREPHMDFNVHGIPRLEDTAFGSIEEYNEHYKAALLKDGLKVRFVSVYRPSEGNTRGSISLRIGSFNSKKDKFMDAARWPSNCRIYLWDYTRSANTSKQQSTGAKNRK